MRRCCWEHGADRLACCRVAVNLEFGNTRKQSAIEQGQGAWIAALPVYWYHCPMAETTMTLISVGIYI